LNIAELLAFANLPPDTNIPVIHSETGQRLTGEKAPKLKNLEQWLKLHPKYKLDFGSSVSTPSAPTTTTNKSSTPTTSKSTSKTIFGTSTPSTSTATGTTTKTSSKSSGASLEAEEVPKASTTPKPKPAEAPSPAVNDNPAIGVFYRGTGIAHPADKWPTLNNLASWLDKNPDSNVQNAFVALAKMILPKSYGDRLGGDVISTSSVTATTSSVSSSTSNATAAATANAISNMAAMQSMEALQLQLLLQQAVFGQSMMAGYNPYSALFGGASTSTANGGVDAATLAAFNALMGPQQMNATATSAASGSARSQTSAATTTTTAASTASLPSSSPAASANLLAGMSANEAALAAELLTNPTLFSMLNPSAMSMPQMQSFAGLDMASLAQLAALNPQQSSANETATSTNAVVSNANSNANGNAKKSSSTKGKLNAVVEKLASSNCSAD
jgi:hypothetical protein